MTIVKVWFSLGSARVMRERIWHPTQEIREQEDGSLVITVEVSINYGIISWILGFGSAAEVLQAVALKKRIVEELEASLGLYRSGGLARTKIIPETKVPATLSISDTRPF